MNADRDLVAIYEAYYASHTYDGRYPRPNPGTVDFLQRQGLTRCSAVLDLGCGSGRYALAWLARSPGHLTACDPSAQALHLLQARAQALGVGARMDLVQGDLGAVLGPARFDGFLLMFGVLGLLGDRSTRVATLRRLQALARPGARLALSVPNVWRREPLAHLQAWWRRPQQPHDIDCLRRIDGRWRQIRYHLYGVRDLREELAEGGWCLQGLEAESLCPESWVSRWPALARWDGALQRVVPAAWGYGLRGWALACDR